jgi:magnesium chelatase family protein
MDARWYLTLSCIVSGASASHRLGTRSLSAEIRKIGKAWIVCLPPGTIRGEHLCGRRLIEPYQSSGEELEPSFVPTDFSEVRGQEHVKRALEVAAAGGHNVLLVGSPGAGKTLLARAMPGILPEMSIEEALDVTRIYSVADQLPAGTPLIRHRPFRSPHHTISHAGLVGGGNIPKPGEISLAHRGVLFLDEFPEFGTRVLEVMRQPMEDKVVTISRAKGSLTFSANFQLIAAMNPCPCGYYGDSLKPCTPFGREPAGARRPAHMHW